MEPRPEEFAPGTCLLTSDFKVDKGLLVPAVPWMSGVVPDLKSWVRALASTSSYAEHSWRDLAKGRWEAKNHGLGRDTVLSPLPGEEEASDLVSKPAEGNKRKKASTYENPKSKARSTRKSRKNTIPLTLESVQCLRDEDEKEEDDGSMVARSKKTTDVSHAAGSMSAPSDSLGAVAIENSPTFPAFSEGVIREAQALGSLELDRTHEGEDPFCDLFTGVEDAAGTSDALDLFHGVQQALNQAVVAHRELQQKLEMIGKLREEVDVIKAESLKWKENMDRFAAEKEAAQAQLSLAENQLQSLKEKSLVQARKTEELEAGLASELAKAEKTKADTYTFLAVYRADAKAAQSHAKEVVETTRTRAHWIAEFAKCQSRRETLEEIHARGFNLAEEIIKAKELEADAGALVSDDDDGSKSGSQSGEEPDGEETAPEDNQET
ncbi:uncharacterized protein [Nicotiana tomentosiformis]|uniref:uncharacterized protein n=1 Tax=Nicotiana tomentosiformis TaxID=4098 RepID=UPI00388CBE97